MMRLIELEPKWVLENGIRVGFIFRCPTRPDRWQSCFISSPERQAQWKLFADTLGGDQDDREMGNRNVQGCTPGTHWAIAGGIETAEFSTMTVTPSLDGSAGGNWHGFITNGEIVGGL